MNSRRVVAILAIVVALIVAAVAWFLRSDPAPPDSPPAPQTAIPATRPAEAPLDSTAAEHTAAPSETPPAVPDAAPVPTITADDAKIDAILRLHAGNSDQERLAAAQSLINLLPTLNKEAQVVCAHRISNLIADKDYSRVMHIWRNPAADRDVLEVFATDLLNRDNKIKLPALLDALRQPTHPVHQDAQNTLRILLEGDFGSDFGKWEGAIQAFLQREEKATRAAAQEGARSTGPDL